MHRSSSPGVRERGWLVLGLACGLALAGCGPDGPSTDGPLGPPGNPTTTCTPLSPGEAMSDGYLSVTNNSSGTLTIERIALASPRSIRLLGAYIVPLRGNAIGDTDGWPPPVRKLLPGVMWADPAPARRCPCPSARDDRCGSRPEGGRRPHQSQ